MTTLAIVQARMGSVRFPAKVMAKVHDRTLIEILLERLSCAKMIDKIIVATTVRPVDDGLAEHCAQLGYDVFRGSEADVLDRYYQAALPESPVIVVRITGDCPLIDPELVDELITDYNKDDVDYVTNADPETYPDGLDAEVFSFQGLEIAWRDSTAKADREHVTVYLRESGRFKTRGLTYEKDFSNHRWTVDEPEDFEVVRNILTHFHPRTDFGWLEVMEFAIKSPETFSANNMHKRNEGAKMGTGQKLWSRAKKVIPGGNMLLSKRAEMFLPDQWPAYFSRAKGCTVWDLDGRSYTDMSIMGIGTNSLGYGNAEVDAAVAKVVADGNMSTFNAPEEVYLAEKLIDMHPFADMARFARSGGEANAIAIRIARAASGRDKIAFCGYHGWHDWYLAANLSDGTTLAGHLLPGLEPKGVPQDLSGSVLPFNYNRFDELEALITNHDVGVIKMEVSRNEGPKDGFLEKVRDLAIAKGIVLIFDECTSGFRETFGGLHKKYGVEPDIAVFGKAIGNGYALSAIIGRRSVMEAAQTTFISSTFWTERIGSAAALKTLEVMEREKSWETITTTGKNITDRWIALAAKHELEIEISGIPAIANFAFQSPNALAYKTLITQEMLSKGYLSSNLVFVSTTHSAEIVDGYFDVLDPIFALVKKCEEGRNVMDLLNGPICHSGFKRLN